MAREAYGKNASLRTETTPVKRSSLIVEVLRRKKRRSGESGACHAKRGKKIAISLIEMGLGDRLILEAPIRLHRSNYPNDQLIAILDTQAEVDLPYSLRRHFDELWWVSNGDGQKWLTGRRSAVARMVRDALIAAKVKHLFIPSWQPKQFPQNPSYTLYRYNCFGDLNYLRDLRFWPKVVVPLAERCWAKEFLRSIIPDHYEALVSVHVRNIPSLPEKNLNPCLIEQTTAYLRTQGRFAFILVGREDGPTGISGPDVFSFVGRKWSFEQTAALIAQTCLFVGADSGPTHAAAGLGVPIIAFGCYGEKVRPFANPNRYVYLQTGDSPQTIMAEVKRFVKRFIPFFGREKKTWQSNDHRKHAVIS
jgi:hypothetical protein